MSAKDIYSILRRPVVTEKAALLKEDNNQVVLRVRADANKIEIRKAVEQLMGDLLPCQSIDDFLGDPGFCQGILAAGLSAVLREVISGLSFADDAFTLQGTVRPVDENGDLVIDKLEGGVWRGRIGRDAEFPGCFNGCRGLECQPAECLPPQ